MAPWNHLVGMLRYTPRRGALPRARAPEWQTDGEPERTSLSSPWSRRMGSLDPGEGLRMKRAQPLIGRVEPPAEVHVKYRQTFEVYREPLLEVRPVPRLGGRPQHFGERDEARPGHVFDALWIRHVLRPDLSLPAEDVLCLIGGELLRYRLICVDVLERVVIADPWRLGRELGLRIVHVGGFVRCHHDVVSGFRGRDPAFLAAPAHDRRPRSETASENLVPADAAPAALREP